MSDRFPGVAAILRQRLVDTLREEGIGESEAEAFADEALAIAREHGKVMREFREASK